MEYATRHLYFPYTDEPLVQCVYEENTSDKWHVPRYPRESIAYPLYPMPRSSENLRKFCEELGDLREFLKTSETIYETFGKLQKQFKTLLSQ